MQEKLTGIIPALITPFTEDGTDFDIRALEKLIDWNLQKGVSGFYVGGSTGEAFLMDNEERKRFLELVIGTVGHRARVIAHVGAISTAQSQELARHAARAGADGISAVPPFYYSFTGEELVQYYRELGNSTSLPLFVYHVPALTGVSMNNRQFTEILQLPQVAGIKFTAYDSYHMQRLIEGFPNRVVINGHDELLLSNMAIGCRCAVGSTFNFMAEKFISMMQAFEQGDMKTCQSLQNQVNEVIDVCVDLGVFRAVKGALKLLNIGNGVCRRPFLPLKPGETERLKAVLIKNKIL